MVNSWFPEGRDSSPIPPPASPGDGPPLRPPDPPDPSIPSYLSNFPPLSPSTPATRTSSTSQTPPLSLPLTSQQNPQLPTSSPPSIQATPPLTPSKNSTETSGSGSATVPISATVTVTVPQTQLPTSQGLLIPPPLPPVFSQIPLSLPTSFPISPPLVMTTTPLLPKTTTPLPSNPNTKAPLLSRLRKASDKSLSRQPAIPNPHSGSKRPLIPDSLFNEGGQIHKNFIVCQFLGRPPAYSHIQNVVSSMWNKGVKLEIHLNQLSRSMLVRIPNEYMRSKILEKKVWHISESMFYVYPWCAGHSSHLDLQAIPIWAHLSGIPLELMHPAGWSSLAEPLGEPREVDDFTINFVSIDTAHIKVEADLTKALPSHLEFDREDGSVLSIQVTYPWLPPTCSHCKEMGHVLRYCHHLPPPASIPKPPNPSKAQTKKPQSQKPSVTPSIPLPITTIINPSTSISLPAHPAISTTSSHHLPPPAAIPNPPNLPKAQSKKPQNQKTSETISSSSITSSTSPVTSTINPSPSVPQPALPTISSTPSSSPPTPSFPASSLPINNFPPNSTTNHFSILASLPSNTSIPTSVHIPFSPSTSIPFYPSSTLSSPSPPLHPITSTSFDPGSSLSQGVVPQ